MSNYDVVVIGAGAGGLTTAMYASRGGLKTLVIEKGLYGGQLQSTGEIENYTGFAPISGADLSSYMYRQAIEQGIKYMYGDVDKIKTLYNNVEDLIEDRNRIFKIILSNDTEIEAKAVVIATGVQHRHLGVKGEEELSGRGVSYCAICDGAFFKDGHVVVVGGGDSALEEANYLAGIVEKVTIVHRRNEFRGQKVLQDRVLKNPKINIIMDATVDEIDGGGKVESVVIQHNDLGTFQKLEADGVFIYVGLDPITEPFKELGIVNEKGYIETDEDMQTSSPGIFAVGDVREKTVRQIATAVGDGAIAGTKIRDYIDSLED